MAYIAIAPSKALDEALLKRAASLVNKEISDMRLLLAGEIPRIVAAYPGAEMADSIAQSLRDAGLMALVCSDSELRDRSVSFVAHRIRRGEGGVIFCDRQGGELGLEAGDAFLIIRGRMPAAVQEKTSTARMKLNVPATLLTGGIPVMRRVTQKTAKESFQAEDFVRVFDRRSSAPRVEMRQNHVDYAFLGSELTPSAPANFDVLVTKLRERFPLAIFDERLVRRFGADVPAAGPGEAVEVNCRLIYLCHLAMERWGFK